MVANMLLNLGRGRFLLHLLSAKRLRSAHAARRDGEARPRYNVDKFERPREFWHGSRVWPKDTHGAGTFSGMLGLPLREK